MIEEAVARILEARRSCPPSRALLVAVSGIDAAGKGYVAARIADALRGSGLHAVVLGADLWLSLPHVRFDPERPAETFYEKAIRFEELFSRLILPLRDTRSVRVEADVTEETAATYRRHLYEYSDVDVIVLEGIFLLRPELRAHYDLSIWVDCPFETALARAMARRQEGLSEAETVRAYETTYFPAQRIHLERDAPENSVDLVVPNGSGGTDLV